MAIKSSDTPENLPSISVPVGCSPQGFAYIYDCLPSHGDGAAAERGGDDDFTFYLWRCFHVGVVVHIPQTDLCTVTNIGSDCIRATHMFGCGRQSHTM